MTARSRRRKRRASQARGGHAAEVMRRLEQDMRPARTADPLRRGRGGDDGEPLCHMVYRPDGTPMDIRRVWGGHALTSEELDALALGMTVTVPTAKGNEVPIKIVRRGGRLSIGIDPDQSDTVLRHHRFRGF